MRIGLVAPPWAQVPPHGYGGIEANVDALSRGLLAAGHDTVLFTTGDSTCPVPKLWYYDRPPEPIGQTVPELRHVQAAYDSLISCDLIHDHTFAGPVWAAATEGLISTPVMATIHGEFNAITRPLLADISHWATLIAISQFQRDSAPEIHIPYVIHHGVDSTQFPIGSGSGDYVFWIGRFTPVKGAHTAIDIAREAGIPIRIAAKMREPQEKEYFHTQIKPLLGPDVEFLGEVSPRERNEIMADAVALVNPITWPEPFGMVMIEALACGTPVIAYPYGAAPEIVQHSKTGFLCKDQKEAVTALHNINTIDRNQCRAAVENYFSAERMVNEHISAYQQTLDIHH